MKQFVIKAYDGEGKLDKRMEVRPRHFEGMEKMKEHILCAGGMLVIIDREIIDGRLYITNATARFCSFSAPERKESF